MATSLWNSLDTHYKRVLGYDYNFKIKGESFRLNPKLLVEKKIDKSTFKKLVKLHRDKSKIYRDVEKDDSGNLKRYADKLTIVEFKLQKEWGFPLDVNYHRFWETPKCECPKMDNADDYPIRHHINMNCPLHGK